MEKLKLAPYFRVSGSAQASEQTIQRQLDNFNACKASLSKEFDIVYRYKDSETYFIDEPYNLEQWDDTTAFYDLIEQIKRNEVHAIWVSETDRAFRSRSREMRGAILDIIENYDIQIYSKNGIVPHGMFLEFMSVVDAEDKKRIMRKLQEGKRVRTQLEGRPPNGRTPFGYLYDKRSHKWSLIEDEVKIIKSAAGLAIGKVFPEMPDELKLIAQQNPQGLNDVGVAKALSLVGFTKEAYFERINIGENHPKANRPEFSRASIENMFRIDRYRGFIEYRYKTANQVGHPLYKNMNRNDKEARRVSVPRILDDSDWDILCQKRHSRRKLSLKNQKHEYLCKDLLICAECGVPLAARPKYPKKTSKVTGSAVEYSAIHYYTCARKQKISGYRCTAKKCHPVGIVDSLVWEQTTAILLDPSLLTKMNSAVEKFQPNQTERLKKQLNTANLKLDALKEERLRALKLLVSGTLSESDFSQLSVENKKLEDELTLAIDGLKSEIRSQIQNRNSTTSIEYVISKLGTDVESISFPQRRELVQTLIHSIALRANGEMEVFYKSVESGLLI